MYTIDDEKEELYDDEYVANSSWDNYKGLIFKIIIIILCVIVLIWLIKALKSNRNLTDSGEVHAANVEKIRLAAEDYFFIQNNKDNTSVVSLAGLKNKGLIDDLVDANDKVCSDTETKVNLDKDIDSYVMKVNLSCSTNDKEEVFYYHINTLACLNCKGKTNMTGNTVVAKVEEKVEPKEEIEVEIDDNNNTQYDNSEYDDYSCIDWSDWTTERVFDANLTERSKTLVQGVKYGTKSSYGEWSDYTTTPIANSDTVEVETKVERETYWSEKKTSTDIDPNNKNIRIISTDVEEEEDTCNGFIEDGVCYNSNVRKGNLTYKEYNSGKYFVEKGSCTGLQTLKNSEGLYVLTYVNCKYYEKAGAVNTNKKTNTVYTYQVLNTTDVVYYRYRVLNTVSEPDSYTDIKYEESNLPEGYVKVEGSEETYYSYKLNECIK